jgi:hypothetical protein
MRARRIAIVGLSLTTFSACARAPQVSSGSFSESAEVRLQQIPPADAQRYGQIRNFKNWRNPYLVIRQNGVALLDPDNNEERAISPAKLGETLAQLPPSAWPYGRVVAVVENGVISDQASFRRNRGIVLGTLEALHIAVAYGPPPN